MRNNFLLFLAVLSFTGITSQQYAQTKFLGNIVASSVPSTFATYWNQVTPENSGKWGSVESSRDNMNWSQLDLAYNYAKQQGFPFKQHTFVWGAQEPGWIGSLSAADQRAEVEEWIQQYGQRYPNTDFIDVVNEPLHQPASYRNALGGSGSTGWDWIITAFQLARQYCPGAKLLLNEYGIISDPNAANQYANIVNILNSRGLIDGVGIQCHSFNMDNVSTSTMNQVLTILTNTGVPIYVSELDMTGDDNTQLQRYQQKFPVLWNHSNVRGITLWGYIQGQIWEANAYLLRSNGTERPALTWLKQFVGGGGGSSLTVSPTTLSVSSTSGSSTITVTSNVSWTVTDNQTWLSVSPTSGSNNGSFSVTRTANTSTTSRSGTVTVTGGGLTRTISVSQSGTGGGGGSNTIVVRARGTNGSESIRVTVGGTQIGSWTLTTSMADYTASTNNTGAINVEFTNDASGRDVQIDYITVNGTTRQAENQATNTGVWQNSQCGGSNSEWLHCNGYIAFGDVSGGGGSNTIVVRARGTNGSENIQLRVNSTTIGSWTLTTSMANYTATTTSTGSIQLYFTNDASGRDVQCDYIQVNGSTRQAENQSVNTALYANGRCGGGSNSEWMHCNGYIAFGSLPKEVADIEDVQIPKSLALHQNFPNPFNPTTNIDYEVAENTFVKLTVYDLMGREVAKLVEGYKTAGIYSATFDASKLTSGVYFYTLETNAGFITNKMILMK